MSCNKTFSSFKSYKIGDISLGKFKSHRHTTILNAENTCQYTFEKGTIFSDKIDQVTAVNGGTRRRRRRKMKTKQSKRII